MSTRVALTLSRCNGSAVRTRDNSRSASSLHVTRQRNVHAGQEAGALAKRPHLGCGSFARMLAMAMNGIAIRRQASA